MRQDLQEVSRAADCEVKSQTINHDSGNECQDIMEGLAHSKLKEETTHSHVRWVPCHHGMARPQVADGGDTLQFWRVAANILNKQSWTGDKGWSSSLGVGRGANNSSP
jgi:hypothetical protein